MRRSRSRRRLAGSALSLLAALVAAFLYVMGGEDGLRGRPRIAPTSPFYSRAACEAHLEQRSDRPHRDRGPRIGTWNVRWFPYGASRERDPQQATDVAWLACAIATLDVDVLAVQEFVQDAGGQSALRALNAHLDRLLGGSHRAVFDDCPGSGFQHVGFLYDASRVELSAVHTLEALNPGRSACDRGLRPGLAAYARFAGGPDLHLVAVHLDSGMEARDYGHRLQFGAALARAKAELARPSHDPDLLVLGDFNSMGCDSCTPKVSSAQELNALGAELENRALERVPLREPACSHYYRGDASALDHVVAAQDMDELPPGAHVEVHGPCADLRCRPFTRSATLPAFARLSDHCPLVIELQPGDRD